MAEQQISGAELSPYLWPGRIVDTLGNDPVRALTFLALAHLPGERLTATEQARHLLQLGGDPEPNARATHALAKSIFGHCVRILEPASLVDIQEVRSSQGHVAQSFAATPYGVATAVAPAVIGLGWELRFREHNLRRLLGETRVSLRIGRPATSLAVYATLLRGQETLSLRQISQTIKRPTRTVHRILSLLENDGVIQRGSERQSTCGYQISETLRHPISDLVTRYRTLAQAPGRAGALRERGRTLLRVPQAVAYLLGKTSKRQPATISARLLRPTNWVNKASCREPNVAEFFPALEYPRNRDVQKAKKVCAGCPVQEECLLWALESGQQYGIFGGLTSAERAVLEHTPKLPEIPTNTAVSRSIEKFAHRHA